MSRTKWIEAAQRAVAGDTVGLRCPENDDGELEVEWIPIEDDIGEYRLVCPECGSENYVLIRLSGE